MIVAETSARDAFTALRDRILTDTALTAELASVADGDQFVAKLSDTARRFGLPLDEAATRRGIESDPLGLSRFAPPAVTDTQWPPAGFLPVHIAPQGIVNWAWFGPQSLTESFFEDSMRKALHRPFNRLFRYQMTLSDFVAGAAYTAGLAPSGFIFHMSRCGSTLVSQMLAQSSRTIVISEAAPIDHAVQICRTAPLTPQQHIDLLRAIVLAFGRPRSGLERHYVIKLDSWHALALPLFEQALPDVPWIFLFRDPLEVMVSQTREPGSQMVPHFIAPSVYGLDNGALPGPDYTARALNSICAAAADGLVSPRGLAINYRDLPDAVERRILPHFGITSDEDERAAMREATRFDAKSTTETFAPDSAAKQAAASDTLRATTERHLGDIFRRLERLPGR